MGIIVEGFTSRNGNLSSMISNYISKKQQTLQDLYQQKAAIEDMYNNVASGLYTTNNSIYQLNSYYNSQILSKNSTINTLQAQIKVVENKVSSLNSLHNSYKTTVTSLDDFLESVRKSSNTSSGIDFSNTNESVMDVVLNPDKKVNTQRIEYHVKQVATATKAVSSVLNGYNISKSTLVKDLFAGRYDTSRLTGSRNDLDESMTMKQLGIKEGYIDIGDTSLYVSETDTLGDIANRLKADGYNAGVQNGQFFIDSKNVKSMNIHNQTSNFGEVLGLTISTGNFRINGKDITIADDTTIQNLLDTINNDQAYGVGAIFEDNQLTLVANQTGNVLIEIDKGTSNFTNVAGFTLGGKMITENLILGSDGSVHTVSGSKNVSSVTGNLSAGEFTISKTFNGSVQTATIKVTPGANLTQTLNNVIAQINASSLNLTASVENDKFVIKNNDKGAGYDIRLEAGDSDFTEKLGFTNPVISMGESSSNSSTTRLAGINNIADPNNVMISAGSFKINDTTINLAAGSLTSAINKINTYTNTTGVVAEFDGANVVLKNQYTGSTNIYVEGGTSNFGEIAGFTTASINTSVATIGQVGSKSTLTGAESVTGNLNIEASVIKINGTQVNIAAGKLSDVVANLNANYSDTLNLTFSINSNNKLVITEKRNGELPISVTDVSGNFAQLTGISGYQMKVGTEEKYGSSRTLYTTTKNVSNNTQILDSVVNINGKEILLSGTIAEAVQTINAHSGTTGVEALIDSNNKFVLRNVNTGSTGITFSVDSGDFGRVVGTGSYTTVGGTTAHSEKQMATVTGANGGLNEFTQVLAGSKIQFGTTILDLGASVGAALLAINNNKDITGVEAYLNSAGQFVLQATSDEMKSISFSVIGVGDFGRVTGLGSYTVGASDSNGEITNASYSKLTGVNNVTSSTEITASNITLSYINDLGVNVSKSFSLQDGTLENAMKTINDANWYVKAEIVNNKLQFVSRTTGPFQIGLSVNAIGGVTGDFGRVVGMASSKTAAGSASHLEKDPATYVGATGGLNANDELIGTNSIKLWMTRTKTNTGSSTAGGSGALASIAQTVTFSDKDGDGKITLQDAIDSINDVKSVTKIEAALVGGQFVLRQIDANTAGEGDTINFTVSGNGDFARVAGYGTYTTIGQSATGSVEGQSFTTLTGSRNVSANNEVLSGSFTLNLNKAASANSAAVDLSINITVSDGSLQNAINSINSQLITAGIGVTASIKDGKLQFKSNLAGDYNISVNMDNSDIGRVVGIGSHTTFDGSTTYVEKTAAKVTGGVSGLTLDSQIAGSVDLTLQGLKTRTTTGVNTEGGTNNLASAIKTITLSGTIGDAINAINAQTSVTQIKAYLDAQGRFILEQTNHNTANEFDTISFSVAGSGDFGAITGLSTYISYGQEDSGTTTGQKNSYIAGVIDNLKGTEQITKGKVSITFVDNTSSWSAPTSSTFSVDISGTVEDAARQINDKARALGLSLEAYIDESNGRFTIKSTSYGPDSIAISVQDSDFARITGIANYSMDYGSVTSGSSSYDLHPVLTGGNAVTEDTNVISGTLKIGSHTISTVNKTMAQIAEEVNNLKLAGVTADLETGYFRIKMMESDVANPYSVEATGDFARLSGLGTYTVGSASYVDGSYTISDGTPSYVTKSAMGLTASTKFAGGSITINHNDGYGGTASFTIDTKGKTIQQVVNEINSVGQSGTSVNSPDGYSLNYVYASFENEQIVIKTNDTSHSISATGDFARVTGFSEYRSGAASNIGSTMTRETGTLQYQSQNKSVLSSTTTFTDGILSITFENGANGTKTISTNAAGKTVAQVISELQTQANNYYAETSKDGYITSRPYISFDSQTGKITVQTYGESHDVSATGNVATLTGFDGNYDFSINAMKDIVTYHKDGTLTGSLDVSSVNGQAIYGQSGTMDFYNGSTKIGSINISAGDDLNTVLAKINSMTVNYDAPADSFNVDYDNSITASIVNGKIQLKYGAGMQDLRVSGTSSFTYFYGLGSTETVLADRSTVTNIKNEKDVYVYSNGSITGSVDVKDMLTTGSLTVGGTNVGPFSGQKDGTLTFVSTINGTTIAVGNVEILATDTLDDVMNKINNMKAVDAITPDGVEINKINGFKASFTADGKIQITYGGQQGAVRIQDDSGFAEYYGLSDSSKSWNQNSATTSEERPYPDRVGQTTVTGSSKGYSENSIVGSLQSGTFSVSLNGKTVNVNYTNTESISVIMSRLIEMANQTDGSGLFSFNGELGGNMSPLTEDRLSYTINAQGQIVITGGVESRTGDKLVIQDISGNFSRLTGIATAPADYTGGAPVTPSTTPGIVVSGTDYIVTTYSAEGSHGSFSFSGASISGLTGNTALTGIKNGGFNFATTDGNKWITVNKGDTVNQVLARINALNPSINAVFDETNHKITITANDNALTSVTISGDTSGFIQRAGLGIGSLTIDANFTNEKESLGHSKILGTVDNLHESHILGNIQGGVTGASETVTLKSGSGSVNITVSDDESLSSVIQKIKNTGKYDAGISNGKIWIKSTTDSDEIISVSDSNFARIVGLSGGSELLGNGTLTTGSFGTMNYTGASIAGLQGSSNITIDSSLAGVGDGSFRITLSDKNSDTVNVGAKSFDVSIEKDMTVDQIMTAIKTAAVNAGVTGFDIHFDSSSHQVKISISGNQAEQITFRGLDEKGTELVNRLGLGTSNVTTTKTGVNTKETDGASRITGSIANLHGTHVMGNLKSETFTISGANGNVNISVSAGESLSDIISKINTQSGGKYIANIDAEGRFYIQSTNQTSSVINVSSTDFTRRVGLIASTTTEGSSSQTSSGSHGDFIFRGAGGSGGSGIDGMKGSTIFSGLRNGSFTFTLGETKLVTPDGNLVYRPKTTYTVNVSSSDSVQTILNKMKQKIVADGNVNQSAMDFTVEVDNSTNKGRIYIKMSGKDASEITFSNDTSGFVTMAGLSNTGATTPPNYNSVDRSYGKAVMTGSLTNLKESHIFGNMQTGSMIIQAGSVSKTINIAATDTIKNIADKISQGGQFIAGLDENGSFFIKTSGENASDITVSGTSDFYKLVGINAGSWSATASQTHGSYGYSKITGSASGLSATQKFNNMKSGNFTISAAGHRTLTVNVTAGTTTVQDVINYINNTSSSDFHAQLDPSTGQLVINTKLANGASIQVRDGTSNYAQIVGLTAGKIESASIGYTGKSDIYSTLTGSTTGLDSSAKFSSGDFTVSVTNPSGNVTSKTFTLNGTENLSTIAAIITNSSLGIKASIDATTGQLVFESKVSGAYTISVADGTSNFAEVTGMTKNHSQIQPSEPGSLAVLTSSKTAENASLLGYTSGTFFVHLTDSDGDITDTQKITISSTDSIEQIAKKITDSGIGIRAEVDALTGKMVLTRTSSLTGGGLAVSKGTSDFTNKIGFTSGGGQSDSVVVTEGTDATKAVIKGSVLASSSSSMKLGALGINSGTFKINSVVINVSDSDTIASLVNKINSAFSAGDPNGVRAEFKDNRVILTSNTASDNSRINIEGGSSNASEVLGFTNGLTLNSAAQEEGLNAIYNLNGTDYETKSNIIALDGAGNIVDADSADEAIRLTIKALGQGIIDIGSKSVDETFNKLAVFVTKFNASMSLSQTSALAEDAGFKALLGAIKSALTNDIGSTKKVEKALAEIGITLYSTPTSSGSTKLSISLNRDKFVDTFINDSAKVTSLLIGDDTEPIDAEVAGSFIRLKSVLDDSVSPISGYFKSNARILEAQKRAMQKELTITNGELAQLKAELEINTGDTAAAQNKEELENFLKSIEEQYKTVNNLINKLNRQYTQSLSVLVINKNNPSFTA